MVFKDMGGWTRLFVVISVVYMISVITIAFILIQNNEFDFRPTVDQYLEKYPDWLNRFPKSLVDAYENNEYVKFDNGLITFKPNVTTYYSYVKYNGSWVRVLIRNEDDFVKNKNLKNCMFWNHSVTRWVGPISCNFDFVYSYNMLYLDRAQQLEYLYSFWISVFAIWIIPLMIIYASGKSFRWILNGFKKENR